MSRELRSYSEAAGWPGPVFFDRSLAELPCFYRRRGEPVPDYVHAAATTLRFRRQVFIAPPWPESDRGGLHDRPVLRAVHRGLGAQPVLLRHGIHVRHHDDPEVGIAGISPVPLIIGHRGTWSPVRGSRNATLLARAPVSRGGAVTSDSTPRYGQNAQAMLTLATIGAPTCQAVLPRIRGTASRASGASTAATMPNAMSRLVDSARTAPTALTAASPMPAVAARPWPAPGPDADSDTVPPGILQRSPWRSLSCTISCPIRPPSYPPRRIGQPRCRRNRP